MTSIIDSLPGYYQLHVTGYQLYKEGDRYFNVIHPVSRSDFLAGSALAVAFFVQELARAVIASAMVAFTLGMNEQNIQRLYAHLRGIVTTLIVFPLGFAGAVFPTFINERVLGISQNGRTVEVPVTRSSY